MLLGYNTNGFTSHSLDAALEVIAGVGYRSVAITLDYGVLDPFAVNADAELERVAARLRTLGLTPVVETGARFLLDPWRKHRPTLMEREAEARAVRADFLRRAIDSAAAIGAGVVSLWSGAPPPGEPEATETLDARLCDELRPLCDHAAAQGVVIGFEPEPGMHVECMDHYARLTESLSHPAFALTLDVGHAHLTEDDGAVATVERFADQIVNVHLEGMKRPDHNHLLPWEGDMDVLAVRDALVASGYAGPATFELSRHSHMATQAAQDAFAFMS